MSSPTQTVYLVSGASRGIGRSIVEELLTVPNTLVIGTVRNVKSPEAAHLEQIAPANNTKLILITMEMADPDSIHKAVSTLSVDHIDVVISNAAIARPQKSIAEVPIAEMLDHFNVNSIGSLVLYQATRHLLAKSANPKFAFLGSPAGSIDIQAQFPFNGTPYNVSKAAVNAIAARLAFEEKGKTIVLLVAPGLVATDMVLSFKESITDFDVVQAMQDMGMKILTPPESAAFVLKYVNNATHADSGKNFDATTGEIIPW